MTQRPNKIEEIEGIRSELEASGYSKAVIDHYLNPRNLGRMKYYEGYGHITSTCGDSMWVWLRVRGGKIIDIKFISDICLGAISAGSALTEMAKGRDVKEALSIGSDNVLKELGGLPDEFVHCAALAADTLKAAIKDYLRFARGPWKRAYQRERPDSSN
jgi:nitrogen fixation NifU-like protein